MSEGSGPPAAAAPMRVEGRVLAGALEMRHDGGGGRGYYIAARAHIPEGANLLQVPHVAMRTHWSQQTYIAVGHASKSTQTVSPGPCQEQGTHVMHVMQCVQSRLASVGVSLLCTCCRRLRPCLRGCSRSPAVCSTHYNTGESPCGVCVLVGGAPGRGPRRRRSAARVPRLPRAAVAQAPGQPAALPPVSGVLRGP